MICVPNRDPRATKEVDYYASSLRFNSSVIWQHDGIPSLCSAMSTGALHLHLQTIEDPEEELPVSRAVVPQVGSARDESGDLPHLRSKGFFGLVRRLSCVHYLVRDVVQPCCAESPRQRRRHGLSVPNGSGFPRTFPCPQASSATPCTTTRVGASSSRSTPRGQQQGSWQPNARLPAKQGQVSPDGVATKLGPWKRPIKIHEWQPDAAGGHVGPLTHY